MPSHPIHPDIRLTDGNFYAADPHPHFRWLRANAPVYWDDAGQAWGITRYDDIIAVAKDPRTFSNSGGIRPDAPTMPYMIDMDDPEHKKRRGLVNRGFTVRRVQEREPRIREICIEQIERAKQRGRFDFVKDLAAWLPLIVIGDMLGVEPDHYEQLLQWSDDLVLGSGAPTIERIQRASAAFDEYLAYQREVIADRRAQPKDDLVSILVHAEIDGERLSDNELLMESLLILIGGDETTRHVISGGMYQLLTHPDQRRTLAADPTKIPTAVEEMLRWVTPIQNMARTATRDVELGGQTIRAGQKLLLLYPSANRDEAVFPEPSRFDIARTPNDHLAFGFGTHFCLGASLARLELRVAFEEILARLPTLEVASTDPPPLRASNFICGIEELPVELRG
ncbi:MAG TPA: cytochrome P450 [Candidatus Binatia bacterium]|nr:cytochrome P450 [Candidatus Binatia bacterium]